MVVYPAIDISAGRAVRLRQGAREQLRVVREDPVAFARELVAAGAGFLHVVDIDAALGVGHNRRTIGELIRRAGCPVQVGGGVRTRDDWHELRELGAARVVLGTAAKRDGALLEAALAADAEAVVVAADTRHGRVVLAGWTVDSGEELAVFAGRMRHAGVRHLLVTAVERDGTGHGPDLEVLETALGAFGTGVIASGGVGSVEDVRRLRPLAAAGLAGVIVGTLLAEGGATVGELQQAAGA